MSIPGLISWPQEMQEKMRKACGLAAEALVLACEAAKAGVTTDEAWLLPNTDRVVSESAVQHGIFSSFSS